MAGVAHQIRVLGRRFAEARRDRARRDPTAVSPDELRDGFTGLLARAPAGCVREHALIDLPAGELPWRETGLVLRRGDEVSVFAAGRVQLSRLLDIWAGPQFHLWLRVGSG